MNKELRKINGLLRSNSVRFGRIIKERKKLLALRRGEKV